MALANFEIGNRTFGVEIEFTAPVSMTAVATALAAAGLPSEATGRYMGGGGARWSVKTDCSVHGTVRGHSGMELVSPILRGEEGFAALRTACAVLNSLGAKVNVSCGLHVHLEARDLTAKQIGRFIKTYAKFEDTIDLMIAPSRRGSANRYCKSLLSPTTWYDGPISHDAATVNSFLSKIDACRDMNALRAAAQGDRTRKVNIESFWRHGTVEVRHHQGTTDAAKIVNWVKFLGAMMTAAAAAAYVAPRKDNGQTAKFRAKWLFNATIQGEVRRFYSRRIRQLERGAA